MGGPMLLRTSMDPWYSTHMLFVQYSILYEMVVGSWASHKMDGRAWSL